ncbi:MAG: polysaccharide deacetylase family protein [Rhodobacteraceae bacterium]|nr:polysaccharide deacetylase family protein [Paracoccaceae bacterium]
MSLLPNHHRYDFSAVVDRQPFDWPNGARLAVYIGMNLECFAFGEGMGAELAPGGPQPDVLNFSWRDYGNRVGVWRMLSLFDELSMPTTALVNSAMYQTAPRVIDAFRSRGDEIAGHGRTNAEQQGVLSVVQEASLIAEATDAITAAEGTPPKGWLGPWISQSRDTPDLLHEAGYQYLLDWCHDEQPVWMRTRGGRILSVPYPQELNDIPQIVGRKRDGADFADMIVDAFEVMLEDCAKRPLVMGIALHAYLMGHPHRFKHLARALRMLKSKADTRVWFTTAGEINDHFRSVSSTI